jgi:hypothetical protein
MVRSDTEAVGAQSRNKTALQLEPSQALGHAPREGQLRLGEEPFIAQARERGIALFDPLPFARDDPRIDVRR